MTTEFQKGMERAAELADLYADENIRMAGDTVALDPILNPRNRALIRNQAMLEAARVVSEDLCERGFAHAERHQAGLQIAELIRGEAKVARPRKRR
jgi:hypothetical protein